jgi:hypothetical protein
MGGSDLSHPRILAVLLVEDQHDVGGHTLLRHQHLLVAVDDKVAALIVPTLTKLHNLFLG